MAEHYAQKLVIKVLTYLLLAFVIFSIGFAAGKEISIRKTGNIQSPDIEIFEQTIVYYLRSTFRCWQCNMIEVYTEELINSEFSDYLESGLLEWQVVDYLQHRELANLYNISGNTVIVVKYLDGEEVSHARLDQVMEKVLNRDEFMIYVREAIKNQMESE